MALSHFLPGFVSAGALNAVVDTANAATDQKWFGRQGTGSSIPNNTYTTVAMTVLDVAIPTVVVGGGSFRVAVAGVYRVSGSVKYPSAASGDCGGQLALNGTGITGSQARVPTATGPSYVTLPTVLVVCAVGDIISMQAIQTSGGAITLAAGSTLLVEQAG